MINIEIEGSYPLNTGLFSKGDWEIWNSLSEEYRRFLNKHNGGFVRKEIQFDTKIERIFKGKKYTDSSSNVTEFFAFLSYENEQPLDDRPASLLHEHIDIYAKENFLPSGLFVIGRSETGSLVCISTNAPDYGAIYYWEWYWQYPWFKTYFDERIDRVARQFESATDIIKDPQHKLYRTVMDALNYASLVKVADSFSSFLGSLHEAEK